MNDAAQVVPYGFCPSCGKLTPRAAVRSRSDCWVCGMTAEKKIVGRLVFLDQEEAAVRGLDYPSGE